MLGRILLGRYMEVSWVIGLPHYYHPFLYGIFHEINQPFWVPPWLWKNVRRNPWRPDDFGRNAGKILGEIPDLTWLEKCWGNPWKSEDFLEAEGKMLGKILWEIWEGRCRLGLILKFWKSLGALQKCWWPKAEFLGNVGEIHGERKVVSLFMF